VCFLETVVLGGLKTWQNWCPACIEQIRREHFPAYRQAGKAL
jgi:hypothetical protein